MTRDSRTARVGVVQAAPRFFDLQGSIEKVASMTEDAAREGAQLVLFPEAYVGGYPWGLAFGTAVGGRSPAGRRTWERYWNCAMEVPGPETERLGENAKAAGVYLAVGVIEKDSTFSGGTLFCTLLYFGPDGTWGEGDGSTLPVVETPFGTVGGLICWENYMPLARMTMYGKGVDIYLAPTADARERWQSTLQHISLEGRCFVLGCNQFVTRDMYPEDLEIKEELEAWPETLCRGGSAVYGPLGDPLAGPLWDREGTLFADLDLGEIARGKFDFDVTGHYARPDVFHLWVNEDPQPAVDLE
jgi:nitrilase